MAQGRAPVRSKPNVGSPPPKPKPKPKSSEKDDAEEEVSVIGEADIRHWTVSWPAIKRILGLDQ